MHSNNTGQSVGAFQLIEEIENMIKPRGLAVYGVLLLGLVLAVAWIATPSVSNAQELANQYSITSQLNSTVGEGERIDVTAWKISRPANYNASVCLTSGSSRSFTDHGFQVMGLDGSDCLVWDPDPAVCHKHFPDPSNCETGSLRITGQTQDDSVANPNLRLDIRMGHPLNEWFVLTVTDDDVPTNSGPLTVTEGDAGTDNEVVLEAHYPGVNYKVCFSGTARYGDDWTGRAGTYDPPSFPSMSRFGPDHAAWSSFNQTGCLEVNPDRGTPSQMRISITVLGESVVEGDEIIRATISPLTGTGLTAEHTIRIVSDESPCTGDPFPQVTEGDNIPSGMCTLPAGTGNKDYSTVTATGQVEGFYWGIGTDGQTGQSGTLAWGGANTDDNIVTGDRDVILEVDGKDDIVFARVLEDDISYIHVTYTPQRAAQPARWVEQVCYEYADYEIHFGCRSLIVTVERPATLSYGSAHYLAATPPGVYDSVSINLFGGRRGDGQPLTHRAADHFNAAKAAAGGTWPVTVEAPDSRIPESWMKVNGGFLRVSQAPSSGGFIEGGIPFRNASVTVHSGKQVVQVTPGGSGANVRVAMVTSALPILDYAPKVVDRNNNNWSGYFNAYDETTVSFEKFECKGEKVRLQVRVNSSRNNLLNPLYDWIKLVDAVEEGSSPFYQVLWFPICPQTN